MKALDAVALERGSDKPWNAPRRGGRDDHATSTHRRRCRRAMRSVPSRPARCIGGAPAFVAGLDGRAGPAGPGGLWPRQRTRDGDAQPWQPALSPGLGCRVRAIGPGAAGAGSPDARHRQRLLRHARARTSLDKRRAARKGARPREGSTCPAPLRSEPGGTRWSGGNPHGGLGRTGGRRGFRMDRLFARTGATSRDQGRGRDCLPSRSRTNLRRDLRTPRTGTRGRRSSRSRPSSSTMPVRAAANCARPG